MFDPNTILSQRPIPIAPLVGLECIDRHHAPALFALIDRDRPFLRTWLAWVDGTTTEQHTKDFIATCIQNAESGKSFTYMLRVRHFLAGCFEIRWNDYGQKHASQHRYVHLGYWLGQRFQGYGIMTHTVMVATAHVFSTYGVERICIACADENIPSQRVATGAGYTYAKTITDAEDLSGDTVKLYYQAAPKTGYTPLRKKSTRPKYIR